MRNVSVSRQHDEENLAISDIMSHLLITPNLDKSQVISWIFKTS